MYFCVSRWHSGKKNPVGKDYNCCCKKIVTGVSWFMIFCFGLVFLMCFLLLSSVFNVYMWWMRTRKASFSKSVSSADWRNCSFKGASLLCFINWFCKKTALQTFLQWVLHLAHWFFFPVWAALLIHRSIYFLLTFWVFLSCSCLLFFLQFFWIHQTYKGNI